jgi:DUF2075 family protein
MNAITCKHCGSAKGFREYGYVEIRAEASRTSRAIKNEDGKIEVKWSQVDADHIDTWDLDLDEITHVACRNCEVEEDYVENLIGTPISFDPGDVVICPDGLQATVATVNHEAKELTVESWHETFKFSEVEAI